MTRLDRYLFGQLLGPFGFFALVFTGIFWLAQSLRLIDIVISNDQSVWALAEVSTLILPNVMMFVIPLSAFAAALYATNRLYVESELVVILTAGQSPWSVARAVAVFGFLAMLGTAAVTLYLLPVSATRLGDRLDEFRQDFANVIVREGQFVHPSEGVTLYVSQANARGEMLGIFIDDSRTEGVQLTYSANRAVLVSDGVTSSIVMFEGATQRRDMAADRFETVAFDRFAYDLTEFIAERQTRNRSPREYFVHEGIDPDPALITRSNTLGRFVSEAHDKLAAPLIALTLPLIALGGVLSGSFRRGGFGLRMTASIGIVVVVQALAVAMKSTVKAEPTLWALIYLPPVVGLGIGLLLIHVASRSKRRPEGSMVPA